MENQQFICRRSQNSSDHVHFPQPSRPFSGQARRRPAARHAGRDFGELQLPAGRPVPLQSAVLGEHSQYRARARNPEPGGSHTGWRAGEAGNDRRQRGRGSRQHQSNRVRRAACQTRGASDSGHSGSARAGLYVFATIVRPHGGATTALFAGKGGSDQHGGHSRDRLGFHIRPLAAHRSWRYPEPSPHFHLPSGGGSGCRTLRPPNSFPIGPPGLPPASHPAGHGERAQLFPTRPERGRQFRRGDRVRTRLHPGESGFSVSSRSRTLQRGARHSLSHKRSGPCLAAIVLFVEQHSR